MIQQDLTELIAGVAAKDRNAFNALFSATYAKLFAVARRIMGNNELAEDAVAEAFMTIWQRAESYQTGKGAVITWMATIVRNKCLDMKRRMAVRPQTVDIEKMAVFLEDGAPGADRIAENSDSRRLLQACLKGLKPETAQALVLAYVYGFSRPELAERFDRPEGTIKTWIFRGLKQLKDCLGRQGVSKR